jgi:hypothetical protein
MGAGPSLVERINSDLYHQWRVLINFRPERTIFPGDVGFYKEGLFHQLKVPRRVVVGGDDSYNEPASVCAGNRACTVMDNFSDPGHPTFFYWGDVRGSRERITTAGDYVVTQQSFHFGGDEALVLYGANSTVECLIRSAKSKAQLRAWNEMHPDLVVVMHCVRFGPCAFVVQTEASGPHTLTMQFDTRRDNNIAERLELRGNQHLIRAAVTRYAPSDYLVPWLTVMPLGDFIKSLS